MPFNFSIDSFKAFANRLRGHSLHSHKLLATLNQCIFTYQTINYLSFFFLEAVFYQKRISIIENVLNGNCIFCCCEAGFLC